MRKILKAEDISELSREQKRFLLHHKGASHKLFLGSENTTSRKPDF